PVARKYHGPLDFPVAATLIAFASAKAPQHTKRPPMLDKSPTKSPVAVPNALAAHWMPFTGNRAFKKASRLLAGAKAMHYVTVDGRKLIDAAAGMWCCN